MENSFDKTHEVASEQKQLIGGSEINRVHPDSGNVLSADEKDNTDVNTNGAGNTSAAAAFHPPLEVGSTERERKITIKGERGKKVEQFIWNITETEINTFSKFVHGKMAPMSENGINKLADAINEATKDDKDKTYGEYFNDLQFDRNEGSKGRAPADLTKRKLDIFDCDDTYDIFLLEQFKQHGIENVFGKPEGEHE